MNLFSIDLGINEIQLLRQSLDIITITGKDAKYVASLQIKLESELEQIQLMLQQQEQEREQALQKMLAAEARKEAKAK